MSVIRCDEHDLIIDTDFDSGCWKCNEEEPEPELSPCHSAPIVEQTEDTTGFCEECGEQPNRAVSEALEALKSGTPTSVIKSLRQAKTLIDGSAGKPAPMSAERAAAYARKELSMRPVFEEGADWDLVAGCQILVMHGEAVPVVCGGKTAYYENDCSGTGYRKDKAGTLINGGYGFDGDGFPDHGSEPIVWSDEPVINAIKRARSEADIRLDNALFLEKEILSKFTLEADGPDDPEALILFGGHSLKPSEWPALFVALLAERKRLSVPGFDPFAEGRAA